MTRLAALLVLVGLSGCGPAQSGPRVAPLLSGSSSAGATSAAEPPSGGAATASAAGGNPGAGGMAGAPGMSPTTATTGGMPAVIPAGGLVAADDPHLTYYGRWLRLDQKRPVASWGPVAVKLRFEGTSLGLLLEDENVDLGAEGQGNVYQFSIDGGDFQLLALTTAPFALASGLGPGAHDVTVVRRTESKWGKTTFLGFQLADGARVLEPDGHPTRRIEVFGDSISAGLANEDMGYYTNQTENGYLAFGPVLARLLDAEWRVEARGGGSFYNDFYLPMIPYFDRAFGPANKENAPAQDNPAYAFDDYQPDVFVLALGTNDFSEQYPHIDEALYVAKYQAFLHGLRSHYPNAEIFCLEPFKPGAPWDEARSHIEKSVMSLGDAHVHAVDGATGDAWLSAGDYVAGDAFHPNLPGHQKIAEQLAKIVRQTLGW